MIAIVLSSARPTRAVSVKDCVLLRSPSSFKTAIRSFLKHYGRPVAHASFRIGCQFLVTEPFRVYFRSGADQQRDDFWIVPFVSRWHRGPTVNCPAERRSRAPR